MTQDTKTVLLVAASPEQRERLRTPLVRRAYSVLEAESAASAHERMDALPPDVVLLDSSVPDVPSLLDTWSAHDEHRWIPVVLVASPDEPESIESALEAGVVDFVSEPLREIELAARLKAALRCRDLQRTLRAVASHDALTGFINRRVFNERFRAELARAQRYGHELSVVLLDVDHLARLNYDEGHHVGDAVLRQFADLLGSTLRDVDTVARTGGGEFGLLLPETSLSEAELCMDRIRRKVSSSQWGGGGLEVTFSAGAAAWSEQLADVESLLDAAEGALQEAKEGGRDRVMLAGDPD